MTSVGTPRRIVVLGSGAREHALAWRLAAEPGVEQVIVAPGNALVADEFAVRDVAPADPGAVVALAEAERVDLVVVGPEAPLVAGVADRLRATGVPAFGPDAGAARIEASKSWCREVATAAGVPMAEGRAFDATAPAVAYARALGGRVVVKADGLAAGKGVTVCGTTAEAETAIREALEARVFGEAGARVVIEERLEGREASIIVLTDGHAVLPLPAARDHKRIGDGDTGPNTGGMGAYSPIPEIDDGAVVEIVRTVHRPVLGELARRGTPFVGALYAGLMLTADGPRLLEFNARFGDPETQVLMPRFAAPFASLLLAASTGTLGAVLGDLRLDATACTRRDAAVAVVLAARGYPGTPRTGDRVDGVADARATGARVFGAGVSRDADGRLVTAGGRVLTVVATAADLEAAGRIAHAAADRISFPGLQRRRDVAATVAGRVGAVA